MSNYSGFAKTQSYRAKLKTSQQQRGQQANRKEEEVFAAGSLLSQLKLSEP